MPLFLLKIKADLENIQRLIPIEGNHWKFDVSSLEGETREGVTFSRSEEMQVEGSRGIVNFIMKFKGAKDQCTIKIVDVKKCDGLYQLTDSGNFVTILGLECRGFEPSAWIPSVDFTAETNHGKLLEIDLSDKDWTDFDDEHDEPLSVMNLEYVIERG
mmetsp:Transcript_25176/g.25383  ORF Transcript_25176/g.25383 Transcript_25176/m.25383 type:complete len:158 (-) Transcript_25176:171-644(-)